MTDLEQLKRQAIRVGATISCIECDFAEDFAEYLDREERVDRASESIEFGCPACESDTVDLRKEVENSTVYIVEGIEEMEQLTGE